VSDLILHHYDASPFTQRALGMLGLKRATWLSVETPMLPPKDDLMALTGGYRGTPVLQIGAEVFVDSQRIARELERRFPSPTFFPGGDPGVALALVSWSDRLFRAALRVVLAELAPSWPEEFRRDREYLFPDVDFATVGRDASHWRAQVRSHALLLARQLADGRSYLGGAAPGLADVQMRPFLQMLRDALPAVAVTLFDDLDAVVAWERRVRALGEGTRTRIDAAKAHAIARESKADCAVDVEDGPACGLHAGTVVRIEPEDSRRGASTGELVIATGDELAIRRTDPRVGTVLVRFPRLGYRLERAA
jgi:glutathione S-transferase